MCSVAPLCCMCIIRVYLDIWRPTPTPALTFQKMQNRGMGRHSKGPPKSGAGKNGHQKNIPLYVKYGYLYLWCCVRRVYVITFILLVAWTKSFIFCRKCRECAWPDPSNPALGTPFCRVLISLLSKNARVSDPRVWQKTLGSETHGK